MYVQRNIDTRLGNHFRRRRKISITYSGSVMAVLFIKHAKQMGPYYTVVCCVSDRIIFSHIM